MSTRRIVGYRLIFNGSPYLRVEDVWPDGAPEGHGADDVARLLAPTGVVDPQEIERWGLSSELGFRVLAVWGDE